MVNIVSLNVNGLRDSNKFQKLCKYCSENYFDVVGIQETFWDDDIVHDFEKYWDGEILYSCPNIARQGVAFLVSNRVKNDVTLVQNFDGRCIHIKIQIEDITLNIVNCYAPNIVSNRSQFFELLMNKLTNLENLVLIGDMNTSMSKLDRSGKALHIEDKAYKSLMKISEQFNIYDIWRARNSTSRIFSWRRIVESNLQQSRIDFIFVPKSISAYVKTFTTKHTTFSDHSFVVLNVDFSPVEKGPGLWIFNNTLLNDEYFVEKVDNLIENEKKCPLFESEMLVWIDNLKYKIKKFSQVYAKDKKKKEQTEYFRLQKEFQKISEKVANGKVFNENKYEEIKLEMQKYEEKICKGAILRSKADWAIDGDKNSAYFLQLEKHRQENNCIKELKDKNGIIISKTDKILDEIHQYYKNFVFVYKY
ncbi:unnamed protein product [Mytilus coruscus]|uniref:exodeoxyribonuclease III n=1 Tax=Mytilus coruscus TaxID=42192 RepID=A0A6J8C1I4_MYTCO|nr:unnamed protein product [Mytilus coruscus]